MKNFYRKVAFGLKPDEKIPSDPLVWATSQITDKIPKFSFKGKIYPEEELRKAGVIFESKSAFRDMFATLTVVDDEKRFVTGQNQNSGHETAYQIMKILDNN